MKLTKLAVVALVGAVSVSALGGSVAQAATVGTPAVTNGKVQFKESAGTGPIVKPGTDGGDEDIIIPEGGGNSGGGALRIEFVPDFDFGTVEYKAGAQTIQAKNQKYTFANGADKTDKYVPSFVQVTDERGVNGQFKVVVGATTFKSTKGELVNSKINLNEETLTNTVYDFAPYAGETATRLTGLSATKAIPTDGTSSIPVLSTQAGKNAEGSKSSIVFGNGYTEAKVYEAPDANDETKGRNTGVTLEKAASDQVLVGEAYVADLTWTLSDTI